MEQYLGLKERTLVVIKPDGVKRAIIGEIMTRFEKAGLKIVGLRMLKANEEFIRRHYSGGKEWVTGMGNKTLADYKAFGVDPMKEMGTDDPYEIGKVLLEWLVKSLSSGPVVAIALQGNHAVAQVRMIIGSTLPSIAQPGTIRGDYSVDSAVLANKEKRAVRNIVHASGTIEEAEQEIALWFGVDDVFDYTRADEVAMFGNA